MGFDPLSLFTWAPLKDMAIAEKEFEDKLGLITYHSKWGVGQLLYLSRLNWDVIDQHIDFDRMNWDSTFAMDFATLASILNTNKVPCRSWEEVNRILEVYQKNWKTRFLVSLCCECLSKVGYLGMPLYYSELIGYPMGAIYKQRGLLEDIENNAEIVLETLILRITDKISSSEFRIKLLGMLESKQRLLVLPFLLHGSFAWASFRKLNKFGGIDSFISEAVPEEIREELFMMLVSATSHIFYSGITLGKRPYDDFFKKIHIEEIMHFGADTSIRTSPHFAALQAELGHLRADTLLGNQATKPGVKLLGEISDAMFRYQPQFGVEDRELTFDRITESSPTEMSVFLKAHKTKKMSEKSRYTISSEWLRKLRTEDL